MTKMLVELLFCPRTFCGGPSGSDIKDQNRFMYLTEVLKICEVHILLFFWNTSQIRVYVGAKTCEVSLCFVAIVTVRVYYVDFFVFFVLRTGECYRFLHSGSSIFF